MNSDPGITYLRESFFDNPDCMKKLMVFGLAFLCVMCMLYAGLDALSNNQQRIGLFFTFVGSMTVIGLVIDFVNHLRTRRTM